MKRNTVRIVLIEFASVVAVVLIAAVNLPK